MESIRNRKGKKAVALMPAGCGRGEPGDGVPDRRLDPCRKGRRAPVERRLYA